MAEAKLPPGPWKTRQPTRLPDGSVDFPGIWTEEGHLVLTGSDWNQVRADCPEVLHAVLALPVLVEAARAVSELVKDGEADRIGYYTPRAEDFHARFLELRAALALVDGEGRADGVRRT
jgi:hypothetical protein